MTVKELKKFLKDKPETDEVLVWAWFADGERYYAPHLPITPTGKRVNTTNGAGIVIGNFDNCLADRRTVTEIIHSRQCDECGYILSEHDADIKNKCPRCGAKYGD